LLGIQGAIDVVHIDIQTSKVLAFTIDYYSFKLKAYNMQLRVIIDHNKRFLDVFVGMLESTNNEQVLHLSSIYWKVTWQNLFNKCDAHEGIKPYIVRDKSYLLMPWLMVPYKKLGFDIPFWKYCSTSCFLVLKLLLKKKLVY